jgi:hypothetical protein
MLGNHYLSLKYLELGLQKWINRGQYLNSAQEFWSCGGHMKEESEHVSVWKQIGIIK